MTQNKVSSILKRTLVMVVITAGVLVANAKLPDDATKPCTGTTGLPNIGVCLADVEGHNSCFVTTSTPDCLNSPH